MKTTIKNVLILMSLCAFFSCVSEPEAVNTSEEKSGEAVSETAVQAAKLDKDGWDLSILDTARNVSYLSDIEKDVILETNKVRSNPKKYADLYVKPRLNYYNGLELVLPDNPDYSILTMEGTQAVNDCYNTLVKQETLPLIYPSEGLSNAASEHALSQGKTANTGHTGVDGSTTFERIKRYGTYKAAGENIAYGSLTGFDIVLDLLIDDGVPNRGHRANILKKEYDSIGVGFSSHVMYETECVITYAAGFSEK